MSGKGSLYDLDISGDRLVFRTDRFMSGAGSMLHEGIYSREFASSLAAAAVGGLVSIAAAKSVGMTALFFVFISVVVIFFPLLRTFVFRERSLEVVIDRSKGTAEIIRTGPVGDEREVIGFGGIDRLIIEAERNTADNPDAVEFVRKISAQHGTVIPGFGEEKTVYLLKLRLGDGGERLIFASEVMGEAVSVYDSMTGFIGNRLTNERG